MIYFIQADTIGLIKLGYTSKSDLQFRLSSLQTASPVPLKTLCFCKGSVETEQRLHEKFHDSRVRGEWFRPSTKLIQFIMKIQGKQLRSKGPARTAVATSWLENRFREKLSWTSDALFARAAKDGISRRALFWARETGCEIWIRPHIDDQGTKIWTWDARRGWPGRPKLNQDTSRNSQ